MKNLNKNILVVAPHADDEVLGCGGSILTWKKRKSKVFVLVMTDAFKGDPKNFSLKLMKKIKKESKMASKELGVDQIFFENLPAPNLDLVPSTEINRIITYYIKKLKITDLIIPFFGDLHHDHKKISYSSIVSARPYSSVNRILFYETLSETEWGHDHSFHPNYFIKLNKTILKKKLKAFSFYKSQIKKDFHPRSKKGIINLASFRGNNICCEFAEAFKIFRIVE